MADAKSGGLKGDMRLSNIISQYDGALDFGEWVKKFELVMTLQSITDWECYLPLFLTAKAFSIYDGLSNADKKSYTAIKGALTRAFSLDEFSAYEAFVARQYSAGEPVDAFLSDLKRLARLMDSAVPESVVKCAFIAGLPPDVKAQLKTATSLSCMSLADVVERARIVLSLEENNAAFVARTKFVKTDSAGKCFHCRSSGHFARRCPEKLKSVTCFLCGDRGHIATTCPNKPSPSSAKNE